MVNASGGGGGGAGVEQIDIATQQSSTEKFRMLQDSVASGLATAVGTASTNGYLEDDLSEDLLVSAGCADLVEEHGDKRCRR